MPRFPELPIPHSPPRNRLLGALSGGARALLDGHLQPVDLTAGTVLYEPGARIGHAYFPHDTIVSLLAVLDDGTTAEVSVFGSEGVLGYASSLISREAFGRYVVQIPGSASRINVQRLREAANADSQLGDLLLRYTEALLAQTFQIVACNALHTVEERCSRWILSTQDRINRTALPLTHEFLAEKLGVQRQTVSLIARTFQSAALIKQHRGGITVLDRRGLEHASCECYGAIRRTFNRLLPGTYALSLSGG